MSGRVRVLRRGRRVIASAGGQRWTLPPEPPAGARAASERLAAACAGRDGGENGGVSLNDVLHEVVGQHVAADWLRLPEDITARLFRGLVQAWGLEWSRAL